MPAHPAIVKYIRDYAASIGIDPDIAERVSRAEALNVFDPSKPDLGGDERSSFGPFQLHYAGLSKNMPHPGLGDAFTRATGLDARDPSTWPQQVKFALDQAKQGGWGPWMGAKAAGISNMQGIGGRGTGQPVATPNTTIEPAAYDPRSDTPSTAQPTGSTLPGQPVNQYALQVRHPRNPQVGTGGYVAPGAPTTPVPAVKKEDPWWKRIGKAMTADATNFGGAGQAAIPPVAPIPGAAVAQLIPRAPIDPQQQEMNRQQLALAMARLNAGTLWG